jgi:uncharacterized protein
MANPFVHIELNTSDVTKSKTFYGKLFDWEMEDLEMEEGPYTMINVGEGTGGGMMTHPIPNTPSAWLPYVEVEDIEEMTDKASSLGAKIVMEVTEVPDMGWLSIFVDPTGAMLGLWESMSDDEDDDESDDEEDDDEEDE